MGGSGTNVHDDQYDIGSVVVRSFNLALRIASAAVVAVGVIPIHTMNDRIALVIGFNLESRVSLFMRLHLLGEERLKIQNS